MRDGGAVLGTVFLLAGCAVQPPVTPGTASALGSPSASATPAAAASSSSSPAVSPALVPSSTTTPSPSLFTTGFLPYGQWATVTAADLRVRAGHSRDAEIVAVLQPGDRVFHIGGAADNDEDFAYLWYFVAYRAAIEGDEVVAEGQGWLAGATYSPGGVSSEWFMEWRDGDHSCPPTPVDQETLERLTDWAQTSCGL